MPDQFFFECSYLITFTEQTNWNGLTQCWPSATTELTKASLCKGLSLVIVQGSRSLWLVC